MIFSIRLPNGLVSQVEVYQNQGYSLNFTDFFKQALYSFLYEPTPPSLSEVKQALKQYEGQKTKMRCIKLAPRLVERIRALSSFPLQVGSSFAYYDINNRDLITFVLDKHLDRLSQGILSSCQKIPSSCIQPRGLPKPFYLCQYCRKRFKNSTTLANHEKTHQKSKLFRGMNRKRISPINWMNWLEFYLANSEGSINEGNANEL